MRHIDGKSELDDFRVYPRDTRSKSASWSRLVERAASGASFQSKRDTKDLKLLYCDDMNGVSLFYARPSSII